MVGFDLYLKLLEEAVRELRGEAVEEEIDPVVTIDAAAYLPDDYVAEPAQRLALYKRLAGIGTRGRDRGRAARAPGPVRSAARGGGAPAGRRDAPVRREGACASSAWRCGAGMRCSRSRPSTPVPPQRIIDLLRLHGRRLRTVREFVLEPRCREATGRDPQDPHPTPRESSEGPRRHADEMGAIALAGLVMATALGACKKPAGPLPPVPSGSGGVLVRAGEAPPIPTADPDRPGRGGRERRRHHDVGAPGAMVISRRDGRSVPDGAELERTMLNRLVDERLQVQEAKRDKVEVTDDELRSALDDIVKRNGGDRERFEVMLKAQGVTWEALRRAIREQILAAEGPQPPRGAPLHGHRGRGRPVPRPRTGTSSTPA
jgi:hypothetical protein